MSLKPHSAVTLPLQVELLLLMAQPASSSLQELRIRDLCASLRDWPAFLALVRHQRVVPLVFESLMRLHPPCVPLLVYDELRRHAAVSAYRVLRAAAEVQRISRKLQAAGFPVHVLKGFPLSQELYGTPTLRQCGDIDLLTCPERLAEQVAIFEELGYVLEQPACRLTPKRLAAYAALHKDFTFRARSGAFSVDLHWRLFHHRAHPANKILEDTRYQSRRLYGSTVSTLCSLDHFNYVAAHGFADGWIYLKSLVDLGGYLHQLTPPQLDAALVRARELELLQQVSAAVHLVAEWMQIEVSSPYLLGRDDAVCRRASGRLYATQSRHNWMPLRESHTAREWMQHEQSLIPVRHGWQDFARRCFYRPRVWSLVDLPDSLFCLYPVLACMIPPRLSARVAATTP